MQEIIKQEWECVVIECHDQSFRAQATDKTKPDNPDEFVDFTIEEVDINDRELIAEGAVFYWYIGYRDENGAPREVFSRLKFRRLPPWTKEEIEAANKKGQEYADLFFPNPNDKEKT